MESLSCLVLKPAAPTRLFAPRLSQMEASGSSTFLSSLVFPSSMAYQLSRTTAKRSLKHTKASSSAVSTTPSTTITVSNTTTASTKKVLVPIGFGTEEMEAVILVDVLRRAGAEVRMASVEPQLEIQASGGTTLVADTRISTCSNQVFDLVALPGGMPGSARLRDCEILKKITSKQAEEKRLYGGISTAPAVTLLLWGLLRRKRFMHSADDKPRKEEFNKVDWAVDHTPHVLLPVANGSEEIEVITIIDILRRAKVDVVVASVEKTVKVLASQVVKIIADKLIGDAAGSVYDLIILPKSSILKKLLKEKDAAGRMWSSLHFSYGPAETWSDEEVTPACEVQSSKMANIGLSIVIAIFRREAAGKSSNIYQCGKPQIMAVACRELEIAIASKSFPGI
ncbi:hypothetical protein CRYUN_Cryun06bG0050900 [Craigia yunnanensis]